MNTYSLVHTHAHTFRIIAEVARKIMEAVLVRGTFSRQWIGFLSLPYINACVTEASWKLLLFPRRDITKNKPRNPGPHVIQVPLCICGKHMFFFVGVSLQLSAALFLPPKGHEQCHVRSCSAMSKTSMSHHSRLAEASSILSEVDSSFLDYADRKWWWSKSKGKRCALASAELSWWEFQCRKRI